MKTNPLAVTGVHLAATRELARDNGLSEERVLTEVQKEVDRLSRSGPVKQFVVLLAIKHVKKSLASQMG